MKAETFTCLPPMGGMPVGADLQIGSELAYKTIALQFPNGTVEAGMALATTEADGVASQQYVHSVDLAAMVLLLGSDGAALTRVVNGVQKPLGAMIRISSPPVGGQSYPHEYKSSSALTMCRLFPHGEKHIPFLDLGILADGPRAIEGCIRLGDPAFCEGDDSLESLEDVLLHAVPCSWNEDQQATLRGLIARFDLVAALREATDVISERAKLEAENARLMEQLEAQCGLTTQIGNAEFLRRQEIAELEARLASLTLVDLDESAEKDDATTEEE